METYGCLCNMDKCPRIIDRLLLAIVIELAFDGDTNVSCYVVIRRQLIWLIAGRLTSEMSMLTSSQVLGRYVL